jgi:hypothetical protein
MKMKKPRDFPKVVSDLFTQCEVCKTWLRLRPDDGLGRTVPVY